MAALASQGYLLLEGSRVHAEAAYRRPLAAPWRGRRPLDSDLFAEQLAALLQAGIGPVESLRALEQQAHGMAKNTLRDVLTALEHGRTLADAMSATQLFDDLLVALVRASEHTSDLPEALQRYLQHAQQTKALRQRIVTASVYPVLLLLVGALVMVFLLTYVIPRFSGIFASIHVDLPWTARLLMEWGTLVRVHGYGLALFAICCAVALGAVVASGRARSALFGWVLRQRHIGHYVHLVYVARLYRTTGTLVEGGIPFPRALQMAAELLPPRLRGVALAAWRQVLEGIAPAAALAAQGLMTPVAEQLLQVGERSGDLGAMLLKAAAFHEGETSRAIERFMRALEPVVMTVLGVGIGAIVIVMYLPIFELASAVR